MAWLHLIQRVHNIRCKWFIRRCQYAWGVEDTTIHNSLYSSHGTCDVYIVSGNSVFEKTGTGSEFLKYARCFWIQKIYKLVSIKILHRPFLFIGYHNIYQSGCFCKTISLFVSIFAAHKLTYHIKKESCFFWIVISMYKMDMVFFMPCMLFLQSLHICSSTLVHLMLACESTGSTDYLFLNFVCCCIKFASRCQIPKFVVSWNRESLSSEDPEPRIFLKLNPFKKKCPRKTWYGNSNKRTFTLYSCVLFFPIILTSDKPWVLAHKPFSWVAEWLGQYFFEVFEFGPFLL